MNYSGVCDDRVRDAPALCIGLMLDRDEGCHRRGGFFFCSRGRRREADPAIVAEDLSIGGIIYQKSSRLL